MRLLTGPAPGPADPVLEMALAHALVRRASRGDIGPTLRLYRPGSATAAFGRSDLRRHGFADAAARCVEAGFEPVVRATGGHAVAYTDQALVLDVISPQHKPNDGMRQRFVDIGAVLADVLCDFGLDARVGEVPGEYCPGSYSINARGVTKLIGTAQRVVAGAWLLSAVVIVDDAPRLRPLLREVHAGLDLPFDPPSVGSVREEQPDIDMLAVTTAITDAMTQGWNAEHAAIDAGLIAEARGFADDHRVDVGEPPSHLPGAPASDVGAD